MKRDAVVYLDIKHVEFLHADGLDAAGGGLQGLRDPGLLESAVMAPRAGYFDSLAELAAALAHGIVKNHPFVDGNKRAGFYALVAFLEYNGVVVVLDHDTWLPIFEGLAAGTVTRDMLAEQIALVMGDTIALED